MKRKSNTSIRLKEIMREKGLKQVDILKQAKPYCEKYDTPLNRNDLSQYISGKTEPGQKKLMILSETLNVNPAWLMGLDVPKSIGNKMHSISLNTFLSNIKLNDIENKIKNDKNKIIISYIDFYDILLYIYPSKLNLLEKENSFFDNFSKNLESVSAQLKLIEERKSDIKITDNININELEDTILFAKKNKLLNTIKKYYSKQDILKEIDKRNIFKITDKNNNLILDEEQRLNFLEELIDEILKSIGNSLTNTKF